MQYKSRNSDAHPRRENDRGTERGKRPKRKTNTLSKKKQETSTRKTEDLASYYEFHDRELFPMRNIIFNLNFSNETTHTFFSDL